VTNQAASLTANLGSPYNADSPGKYLLIQYKNIS